MRNSGLEEAQAGIKIAGRNINNLRYAGDTTLMAESTLVDCLNVRFIHRAFLFIYLFLLYNIVLVLPYSNMHPPRVYMCSPSWILLPPPSPYHPSGSSQCTSSKLPASWFEHGLEICFLYDIIHVLMPFSQIIPASSPKESKMLFYTSLSLFLSHVQGCHYHFSKFHIYALVYCIGVFLSGLLHSV